MFCCLLSCTHAGKRITNFSKPHAWLGILQVGKGTSYTPTAEDVGSCLKCEVAAVDIQQNRETGSSSSPSTARVRPIPLCPQRALVPVAPPRGSNAAGKFTALTYNLLADLYASVRPASAALKAICMLHAQSCAADFTLMAFCQCRTESLGFVLQGCLRQSVHIITHFTNHILDLHIHCACANVIRTTKSCIFIACISWALDQQLAPRKQCALKLA